MTRLLAGGLRRPALAARTATSSAQAPRALVPLSIHIRWVSTSWLAKKTAAKADWDAQAMDIKNGHAPHPYDVLQARGFIHQTAGKEGHIKELMRLKRTGAYCGVDPTADSLHLGHLLPFMVIFWMWFHGFQAVTLLGGSTARIGDPTDRETSRPILSNADLTRNITKIHYQLKKLWANVEDLSRKHKYSPHWGGTHRIVNNNMWLQNVSTYDMMKRLGRHIRIGPMLSKETVKRRVDNGEGMTFGEFMYPLFQGWDFWHLYDKLGVQLQIGGSDQFGNIVQGIDYLKTIRASEEAPHMRHDEGRLNDPYGITVPLLTDASGAKFGKTAGNAIWLDNFKTSAFDLYGYLLRQPDKDVEKYLKLFTFLPIEKIAEVMQDHAKDPPKRVAQHLLAFELLSLVHGSEVAVREQMQHMILFGKTDAESRELIQKYQQQRASSYQPQVDGNGEVIAPPTPEIVTPNNAPRMDIQLPRSLFFGENASLPKIIFAAGMAESRSEAQRMIKADGINVAAAPGNQKRGLLPGNLDWTPAKLWFAHEILNYLIDEKIFILRRGKHNVRIIELVPDEQYAASGQKYPGQPYTGKTRSMIDVMREAAEAEGVSLSMHQLRNKAKELGLIKEAGPASKLRRAIIREQSSGKKRQENDDW